MSKHGPNRHRLSTTRAAVTHDFCVSGFAGSITVGLFEDGRPGEVFIKASKSGSTVSGLFSAISVIWSLALQYNVPVSIVTQKLRGMRFEPSDFQCSSILDHLATWFEGRFGEEHQP